MIYVYTFRYDNGFEQDYCQFTEYTSGNSIIARTNDLPYAIILPYYQRGLLHSKMKEAIKTYMFTNNVQFKNCMKFPDDAYDIG